MYIRNVCMPKIGLIHKNVELTAVIRFAERPLTSKKVCGSVNVSKLP